MPQNSDSGVHEATLVAAIGSSAGGLEAITKLVQQLDPDLPCAFVVLQHLSPSHRSMMVEILSRETKLAVKELENGETPRAGTIYVVPSNSNASLSSGHFHLVEAPPEVVPKPSINHFLTSLAAEQGDSAIGIILSGTGSDGTAGLRAIQAAGGYTYAQRPESAKYDGMPRSAIDAGVVDHVLSPEEIASSLKLILESTVPDLEVDRKPDLLDRLLGKLKKKLNSDFSGYKTSTLMRRVRRREIATGCLDLASYLDWVNAHPEEIDRLAKDILISVTAFFRDKSAYDALREAIGKICAEKSPGSEIRVWVAGCASGEEAYSIAMLFANCLGERLSEHRIQIFATDLDDDALNVARRGVYPAAAMSEMPNQDRERYFKPLNQAFEAGKVLRDMIVFARHNLVSDPPFLRLDLVSCRNVLIYFDALLQAKVLQTFHFGLQKEGVLFLGHSESISQAEHLFLPINRRERLFRKNAKSVVYPASLSHTQQRMPVKRGEQSARLLLDGLVNHFGLTAALCDLEGNIIHTAGRVDRFFLFPEGSARLSIPDATVPELRGELLTLLHRFGSQGKTQQGRKRRIGNEWVRIRVEPAGQCLIVLFMPEAPSKTQARIEPENSATPYEQDLENELSVTREHLQTIVEELATSNEEMQALNEEAQASNEELQATNEELETANEELQASNEELASLNEELSVRTTELSKLYDEYAHLYDSLEFPAMVFDRSLHMLRYNLAASRRFDLLPTSLHQHVSRIKLPAPLSILEEMLMQCLANRERREKTIEIDQKTLRIYVTPGSGRDGDVTFLIFSIVDVSDLVNAREALSVSEKRLTAIMQNTSILFAMMDVAGNYLYLNQRFVDYFNLADKNLAGENVFSLLSNEMAVSLWDRHMEALRSDHPVIHDLVIQNEGKDRRWLHLVHQRITDNRGKPVGLIMQGEDVTEIKNAEEQLRITARIFNNAGEAILVTDSQARIQAVNPAFTTITGYSPEEARGKTVGDLLRSGKHSEDFYQQMWHSISLNGNWQGEIWNKRKNGEIYPEWLTINCLKDIDNRIEHYIAVFSDISDIRNSRFRAEYLSTHDILTGLANRTLFQDRLKHALAQARRKNSRLALLFVDLDNFKNINDTLGHDVGDELLKMASKRLQEIVRDVDTVARLGGDEFTVIVSDCDAETAGTVGRRIVDDLSASFEIGNRALFVSASVGIAFYPEDGMDSQSLIKSADTAMYRAKESGRNRVEFFLPEMHVRLMKRAALESALRIAMDQQRLRLVYQPKYHIDGDHGLAGAEALVRWNDPELGEISPAEFIPISESSGLILQLGMEVERMLTEQIAAWLNLGLKVPKIAFNVSPKSIRETGMGHRIRDRLNEYQVPASLVQIEITEGALLENSPSVIENTSALSEAGITISIDDFGTGYSSLAYLKRLPLSELKIDKSFVDGVGSDPEDEAIAKAILGLAKAVELEVVAEGVENMKQLEWLEQHGCDMAQGFHFSRPLEAPNFEVLLAKNYA